ncbi:MAG: hypothetical protein WC455_14570 [Dehalococcoidia bacterium]|jgi:hypothetical protein
MTYLEQRLEDLIAQERGQWSLLGPPMFQLQKVQAQILEVKAAILAEQEAANAAAMAANTAATPGKPPTPDAQEDGQWPEC